MINEIIIYDIPVHVKEYHKIHFNHEENEWIIHGHDNNFMNIPSHCKMYVYDVIGMDDVIHFSFNSCEITLYPYSIQITMFPNTWR